MTGPRFTRRLFTVALVGSLAGCSDVLDEGGGDADGDGGENGGGGGDEDAGEDRAADRDEAADNLALKPADQQGDLQLTSSEFGEGEQIPERYGYDSENVNPPLSIEDVPDDTASLALVVDDPDAVESAGKIWVHWLVWNVPPETTSIPEDWSPSEAVEGKNDFGESGYDGPSPPAEEHTYRFKLYALETTLDLEEDSTVDDLGPTMEGQVLARTQLSGTFPP